MNTTLTLTRVSLLMFLRNRQALFFTLFMPLTIMVIFGLIGFDRVPTFSVGIIQGAPNTQTAQLISHIKTFPVLEVEDGSRTALMKKLTDGNLVAVLDIPDTFIEPAASAPQTLTMYGNEGQQAQVQTVASLLSQYLDKTSLALAHAPTYFTLKQETVNARNLKYIDFLLPGLIAMSVMQMAVFSVAFVFVQYKEKGVLKRLAATPMRPEQFVAANIVTRLLVSLVQTAIFILVGIFVLKAHIVGSYLLVTLCVLLGALMFLGLGFAVSGVAKTVDTVPALANLLVFPMLFLGGTFFPLSSMPSWLQKFAQLLPLTHFSGALRDVMTNDASFRMIADDVAAMLVWAAILIAIAIVTFSFQERENA